MLNQGEWIGGLDTPTFVIVYLAGLLPIIMVVGFVVFLQHLQVASLLMVLTLLIVAVLVVVTALYARSDLWLGMFREGIILYQGGQITRLPWSVIVGPIRGGPIPGKVSVRLDSVKDVSVSVVFGNPITPKTLNLLPKQAKALLQHPSCPKIQIERSAQRILST